MASTTSKRPKETGEAPARKRILDAAVSAFTETGFAGTSTLEIATRARVSKRELYTLVGTKKEMLHACIAASTEQLTGPVVLPVPRDRENFARMLGAFGRQLLSTVSAPTVIAVFRLAVAEATRAPEVAQTLDSAGRAAGRAALVDMMASARSNDLLRGDPAQLAEQFSALLWGDLMVSLLLGVAGRPSQREIARRARDATAAFLSLHPG